MGLVEWIKDAHTTIRGSGALVSDYLVLTAGHAIHQIKKEIRMNKGKGIIGRVYFSPARKPGPDNPYGVFTVKFFYIGNPDEISHDYAVLILHRPAGHSVGYLGYVSRSPLEGFINPDPSQGSDEYIFTHLSYPGDHRDEMWMRRYGIVLRIDDKMLVTDFPTKPGQSGGPLVQNWFSSDPEIKWVIGELERIWEDEPEHSLFIPGTQPDPLPGGPSSWLPTICFVLPSLPDDERRKQCFDRRAKIRSEYSSEFSKGSLPNYSRKNYIVKDNGPKIIEINETEVKKQY